MSFPPAASYTRLNRISDEDLLEAGMECGDHNVINKRSRVIIRPHTLPVVPGESYRRVHQLGNCLLTQKQIQKLYQSQQITDEELENAGIEPTMISDGVRTASENRSLTADELGTIRNMEQLRVNRDAQSSFDRQLEIMDKRRRVPELKPKPKKYVWPLMDQLAKMVEAEPDAKSIFSEYDLNAIYWESERAKFRQLDPRECRRRKFDAFYEYLEDQFLNGDRDKAIDVVTDALDRLAKQHEEINQALIDCGYSSRSFILIPAQGKQDPDENEPSIDV